MSKSPIPKVGLDPHPPQYRTPVPSAPLPRDPRLPSDMPGLLPTIPAARDTDPISSASGEYEVADSAEKTPVDSIYGLRAFAVEIQKLTEATKLSTKASRDAADAAIATRSELRAVVDEVRALTRRVTALELSSKWVPLTLSAVSLALVLWFGFQSQQTQAQLQQLQAQIALLKHP